MFKSFLAAFVIASSFCTPPPRQGPKQVNADAERPVLDTTTERYAVYSALLNERFGDRAPKFLVIQSETEDDSTEQSDERWDNLKKALEPCSHSVVDDYRIRNVQPATVENKFRVPIRVVLVSKQDVDRFFGEGGREWEAFYRQYPKAEGLIRLSNVGFNPEMNQALVYFADSCGGLCGSGGLLLMVKKDGNWTFKEALSSWVS